MAVLRELIAVFGVDFDSSEIKEGDDDLKKLSKTASAAATQFMEIASAVASFVQETSSMVRSVDRASQALGMSAEAYQVLGLAAQSVGIDVNGLGEAMGGLAARVSAAAQSSQANRIFEQIGVSVKDASGELRSLDAIFADVAEGIKNTNNPTERLSIAMQAFGDKGRLLLPVLMRGRDGLSEFREQLAELGGGVGEDAIAGVRELSMEEMKLSTALTSLRSRLLVGLLPVATRFVAILEKTAGWFAKMTRGSRVAEIAAVALGAVLTALAVKVLIAFAPAIGMFLLTAAAIGIVVAVVDDLIVMFEGGHSVIGEFIDSLFGVGTAASWVDNLTESWENLSDGIEEVIETWKELLGMDSDVSGVRERRRRERDESARTTRQGEARGIARQSHETTRAYIERVNATAATPATPARAERAARVVEPRSTVTAAPAPSRGNRTNQVNNRTQFNIYTSLGQDEATIRRQIETALERRDREIIAALDQSQEGDAP